MRVFFLILMAITIYCSQCVAFVRLSCDPLESKITFRSKILSLVEVSGEFEAITVDVDLEDTQIIKKIQVRLDSNSIDTNNKTRDRDLRKSKFLDSINHPFILFTVNTPVSVNQTDITGNLSIKGIEKSITIPVKLQYYKTEGTNQYVLSVKSNNIIINRNDFNINAYPFLISDEVMVDLDLILKVYMKSN
jgi:polyisoprenoid-binding protein YceI